MIKKLLFYISGKLPCRIISDDGTPYLERYYICTMFGVRFYIHRFIGSDPSDSYHDHPWRWARSIVLSGSYVEETRSGSRLVRWFNKLTGDTFHRVVLLPNSECWTLFFHSAPYVKPWGFFKRDQTQVVEQPTFTWTPWNYPLDGTASKNDWWEKADIGEEHILRKSLPQPPKE